VRVDSGHVGLWLAVDLLCCEPGDEVITSPLRTRLERTSPARSQTASCPPRRATVDPGRCRSTSEGVEVDDRPAPRPSSRPPRRQLPRLDAISAPSPTATGCSCDRGHAATSSTRIECAARARARVSSDLTVTASGDGGHSLTEPPGRHIAVDAPSGSTIARAPNGGAVLRVRYLFRQQQGDERPLRQPSRRPPYDMVFLFLRHRHHFEPSEIQRRFRQRAARNRRGDSRRRTQQNFGIRNARQVLAHHEARRAGADDSRRRDHVDAHARAGARGQSTATAMQDSGASAGSRRAWCGRGTSFAIPVSPTSQHRAPDGAANPRSRAWTACLTLRRTTPDSDAVANRSVALGASALGPG